ncbi:thiamine pyrophosphate-binding protein [Caldalkalibacillus salinus]|uniref:thiamine pyrophosphate-binding protein n=1 Tax=Caldalkalibacillus salinus TaxID=2803787 RepID=UPI00192492D1|nr:thiamine pyrophosphate-binding protein [Caldalkalibacillus salinus]
MSAESSPQRQPLANTDGQIGAQRTVAQTMLELLHVWGIENMYGVIGDATLDFIDTVAKQDKIHYYAVGSENGAAMMASTEGKLTQKLAVAVGTSGPGLANMLNGIADAAADRIPILVITGQVESSKIGTEAKQYVNQQQLIGPLAVYSEQLTHPDATVKILKKAILQAKMKKGVAHVSVPKDVFSLPCSAPIEPPVGVLERQHIEAFHQLPEATMLLANASKPMLLIGEGARAGRDWILNIAESLQAGIIETLGAKGTIPYTHPQYVGGIGEGGTLEGRDLLRQSDVVLVIGANWWPEGFVPQQSKVVQVDLAATSIEAHPNTVYGLVGDVREVLPQLYEQLQSQPSQVNREQWSHQVTRTKTTIDDQFRQERSGGDKGALTPQRIMAAIDQTVDTHAIMVLDTGDNTIWYNRIFQATKQDVLYSGKWRTMGYALPGAISAKINEPDRQVVAVVGDGGFQMSMSELATAVKYKIPMTIIVLNNHALAMEKHKMEQKGLQSFGASLQNPNFAELATAYGAKGRRVSENTDLISELKEAYQEPGPVVLDVHVSETMPPLTGKGDEFKKNS